MKTKTMKRLAAAAAAVMMMCAVPMAMVSANTITIDTNAKDSAQSQSPAHSYKAYQIFSGQISGSSLININWGSGIKTDKYSELLEAIKGINVNGTPFSSCTSASDVADVLSGKTDDSDIAVAFAEVVSGYTTGGIANSGSTIDIGNNVGYYLVEETGDAANSAKTRYILKAISANTTISPKMDYPTIDKTIKSGNTWVDANTAAIKDVVEYKLSSKVPDMTGYNKYYYIVNDTLSSGLVLDMTSFTVKIDSSPLTLQNGTDKYSATGYYVEYDSSANKFKLVINNFISYKNLADKNIEITYKAYLGGSDSSKASDVKYGATPSTANINSVHLTYSNDPNYEYKGENGYDNDNTNDKPNEPNNPASPSQTNPKEPTADTPEDTVCTYTASLNIQKNKSTGGALEDAGFTLFTDSNCTSGNKVGSEQKSDSNGKLSFKGLKEGTYYLKETTVPSGYNPAPVYTLVISSSISSSGCTWKTDGSTTGMFSVTADTGEYNATIINNAGATLPGTGGIGTTVFYVSGGILVLGAGVVFITKKRMSMKDDEK